MNWKEFLKPTVSKIIILIVLFAVTTPISSESRICNPTTYGFPLKFFQPEQCFDVGPCIDTADPGPHLVCLPAGFSLFLGEIAFIINLIFWYLVSSVIVFLYNKKR